MSMNPLRLLSRNHDAELEATLAAQFEREQHRMPPLPMIDKAQSSVTRALEQARDRQARLEREIAERSEDLRQTVVVIEAFEASAKVLQAGNKGDEELKPIGDMAARRVPRQRGSMKAMAEAEEITDADGNVIKSRNAETGERRVPRHEAAE